MRRVSQRGVELVAKYESYRDRAYDDGGGVWTIGFGHTRGVKPGDRVTYQEALDLLRDDLDVAERDVRALTDGIPLSQSMYDALVSLTFNIGGEQFAGSTLLKHLQVRQYHLAAAEFGKWHKDNGKRLWGLSRRRAEEQLLFVTDDLPKEGK